MHRDSEQVYQLNTYLSNMVNKGLEYSREPDLIPLPLYRGEGGRG